MNRHKIREKVYNKAHKGRGILREILYIASFVELKGQKNRRD